MGAKPSKKNFKPMCKIHLEVVCDKIYQYLLIHRGRKIDQLAIKERQVKQQLNEAGRIYGDCLFDISSIVTLLNWIIASKIIMRYVQFLKERSIQITSAANEGNASKIIPLMTYIQSVIWSMDKLNLKEIKEFTVLIMMYFGQESIRQAKEGVGVDQDLIDCFKFVEPTPKQVGDYLRELVIRYNFEDIDVDSQVPPKFRGQPCDQPPQDPPAPKPGNGGDEKFNPKTYPSTGFFDNPHNMAGQKNWGGLISGQFQNQNMGLQMPNMSKLVPGESQHPAGPFNQMNDQFPQPNDHGANHQGETEDPENEYNIDNMLNQLNEANARKEGNQPMNPCMSHIKTNKISGLPGENVKKDEEDFDALMASLQHGIGGLDKPETLPVPVDPPKMRGAPTRRNKAKKPIPNEPEAYKYSAEMDKDTEEKYYEDLSLQYRIEEMRKLQV